MKNPLRLVLVQKLLNNSETSNVRIHGGKIIIQFFVRNTQLIITISKLKSKIENSKGNNLRNVLRATVEDLFEFLVSCPKLKIH